MSQSLLLSGNEAVARGAWEAGVAVGVGYPGTPSTETLESLARLDDVTAEWAPNEKVALEVAAGVSVTGARALVTMKHVGLNVAADPLLTLAYTGVNGGLVLFVADDPGMHSSQNEQDSHNYAAFAGVIMLDPSTPQEAYEMTKKAFAISERFKSLVMVRSTVRVSHTKQMVTLDGEREFVAREFEEDPSQWVMMPAYARSARIRRDDRLATVAAHAEECPLNRAEVRAQSIGLIASGVVYEYVREALPEASTFKLGISYPLCLDKLRKFAQSVDQCYIAEEADTFFERELKAAGIPVLPLNLPRRGELTPQLIRQGVGIIDAQPSQPEEVLGRPPLLCAGCPHRSVFYALDKMGALVIGDIGCYTLGAVPPLEAIDTCVCMGASVSMAHGAELGRAQKIEHELEDKTDGRPIVGIIGDSTFAHSGITGIIDATYNAGTGTIVILDNRITAMTGHQGNPVNGKTLSGAPGFELELEPLLRACGVESVITVDPTDHKKTLEVLKQETAKDCLSVVICRSPCILLTRSWPAPYACDQEACRGCRKCCEIGCPAISFDEKQRKASIDREACKGCGLCAQICPFDAFFQEGEES